MLCTVYFPRPVAVLFTILITGCASTSGLAKKRPPQIVAQLKHDADRLSRLTYRLENIVRGAQSSGILSLGDEKNEVVKRRTELRVIFRNFLDHALAIDRIREKHSHREGLDEFPHMVASLMSYAADLALYINTAKFLADTAGRTAYDRVLMESNSRVPKDAWHNLKTNFNLQPWHRPLVLIKAKHELRKKTYAKLDIKKHFPTMMKYIRYAEPQMLSLGADRAPIIAIKGGVAAIARGFSQLVFPAQAKIAEWMGDTKTKHIGQSLISQAQIKQMRPKLRAGDILLERRNWYLSNIGLPGFWPHAALYLGTPKELAKALGPKILAELKQSYPQVSEQWKGRDNHGDAHRVIEAMSEGVVFTSIEHSADADYVAVLRPKLTAEEIGQAIQRAFSYHGRPYDFEFDFITDKTLVCSELIYKAYEPRKGFRGIKIPLVALLNRPTLPANDIAKMFATQLGTKAQQLEFIYFLDGNEASSSAIIGNQKSFRESHTRSKWDIMQP